MLEFLSLLLGGCCLFSLIVPFLLLRWLVIWCRYRDHPPR